MKKKSFTFIIFSILISLITLFFIQALLVPKYMSSSREGNLVAEYYKETTNHDVLFVGDCEVYENFSPITLWKNYGITSYIRGSGQQLIWQSYYLLEEMLEKETPKAVVFNVLAMEYNEPQKEEYNRMSIDGMKWSSSKINNILASMLDDESFISYVFPLLRFHSRWNEITDEDFKYIFKRDNVSIAGYMLRADVKPLDTEALPSKRTLSDYSFGDNAYYYLDKMRTLCQEKGVQLILIKAPVAYPYWYEQWDEQIKDYAEKYNLTYINFIEDIDTIGIDFNTDTYDGGLHLNVYGAEKLSDYFGKILADLINFDDHSNDEQLNAIWQQKCDAYDKMKELQLSDLAEYGYLKSLGQKAKD